MYRIIFNKMSGLNSSDIEELWLPSLSSLDDETAKYVFSVRFLFLFLPRFLS